MESIIEELTKQKKFFLKSYGLSMLPILKPGDILYFKKVFFNQVKINDFIFVKNNTQLFTHRVIYKSKNYLITKGDNNPHTDGRILPHQIIAKVYQVKRKGKKFNPEDVYLFQSTLYFQEIIKIKEEFEKKGVNFVFLKGLPVYLHYQGRYPRRIYADCDILLEDKEIKKIDGIFLNLGYKKAHNEYSKIHLLLKNKLTEISYYKYINNFPIIFDIHFEPVFMMNQIGRLEEIYSQKLIDEMSRIFLYEKRNVFQNGEKFPILSQVNLFIYLSLHLFHHNFHEVYRLNLIKTVIERDKLLVNADHINKLQEVANQLKINNYLYPTLLLLRKYYDIYLPIRLMKSLKPTNKKNSYILKMINSTNIFDGENRIKAGIIRFRNLFYLSPQPIYRKLGIIFNISVLYNLVWIIWKGVTKVKKIVGKKFS